MPGSVLGPEGVRQALSVYTADARPRIKAGSMLCLLHFGVDFLIVNQIYYGRSWGFGPQLGHSWEAEGTLTMGTLLGTFWIASSLEAQFKSYLCCAVYHSFIQPANRVSTVCKILVGHSSRADSSIQQVLTEGPSGSEHHIRLRA